MKGFSVFLKVSRTCGVSLFLLAMADDTGKKKKKLWSWQSTFPQDESSLKGDDTRGLSGHGRGSRPTEWEKKKNLLKGLSESEWDRVYVLFDAKCCTRKWRNKSRIMNVSLEKPKGFKESILASWIAVHVLHWKDCLLILPKIKKILSADEDWELRFLSF